MSALFDAVRHISAVDAAERAGIQLVRRGGNYWCCCPIHREKTPSLKFYGDNGGFYCFGCHKGGDATKLYAYLYNMEAVEAAQALAGAFGISVPDDPRPAGPPPPPKPSLRHTERAAQLKFDALYDAECKKVHAADAFLKSLRAEGTEDWDNPVFVAALRMRAQADDKLDAMNAYTMQDKLDLLAEGGTPGG